MKKTYYIPTIEIMSLIGMPVMQFGDWSEKAVLAPKPPRRDPAF